MSEKEMNRKRCIHIKTKVVLFGLFLANRACPHVPMLEKEKPEDEHISTILK